MRRNKTGPNLCVFPGYKWCGPGCSGPGAPINSVDAACKAHDLCYEQYGPSCRCDRMFMRRLKNEINPETQKGRHAFLLYQYMKLQTRVTCQGDRCGRNRCRGSWI
ncbi:MULTISPECIES: phospholipase [unclassified Rossellomorea]|uniref:phospholipase n=1 Tax=unclassified Rossellomorea TaxID=2837526 RepID=UPI0026086B32|nr:phospholipase [uncultured Rossellomorea sp.]